LEHALRWKEHLATHDTRDLVRDIGLETVDRVLAASASESTLSRGPGPLFCEWCSIDWHVVEERGDDSIKELGIDLFEGLACEDTGVPGWMLADTMSWQGYYNRPEMVDHVRPLIERGVGAVIGYLMRQGESISCRSTGQSCGASSTCCDGTCSGGRCCFAESSACAEDGDCCSGICNPTGTCATTRCADTGATCSSASQCCSNICGSDGRCGAPACGAGGATCTRDSECCNGLCLGGSCSPTQCATTGQGCGPGNPCCGENSCLNGTCGKPPPIPQ
jgi:hypothetical protein